MENIIRLDTSQGDILIEVDIHSLNNARGENKLQNSVKTKFKGAIDSLRLIAEELIEKTKEITSKPDELEVKFGLKFTAEAGAIIAKTSAEGNLEITMKWKKA